MATLGRRVQILFDPTVYAALEAEASAERQSVAAVIREAVKERLDRRKGDRREALDRLFARADALPPQGPIDWNEVKDSFERDSLRDLP